MINLLADNRKEQIRAARTNVVLVRYTIIILLSIAFLLGILFISYTILQNTKESADTVVEGNDLKANVYIDTKTKVDALSAKLSESKTILSQEVRYSRVLLALGQSMPAGTVLDSLKLTANDFHGTPVELIAYAKTSDAAATIRDALQASPLFAQVNLKGTDTSDGISGYPVKITLSVQLNSQGVR